MLQFEFDSGQNGALRIDDVSVTAESISETIAPVIAGVTGTIRSSVQDGCSINVDNLAKVRQH